MKKHTTSLHAYFEQIPDFRLERNKMHSLSDIIILSVLAVLSGAESWNAIELYGREKLEFMRTILSLPNGIPSYDTINRVFSMIKPELIESAFISWVQSIKNPNISSEVIAIDGKCIRGSRDTFHNNKSIYMVSAWASKNGLSLGQIKVDEKSNEITAIPELLDLLDIKNMTVSIDAIGTQHDNDFEDNDNYKKILRAQISRYEIALNLYNALSSLSSVGMVELLEKYKMFDDKYKDDIYLLQILPKETEFNDLLKKSKKYLEEKGRMGK